MADWDTTNPTDNAIVAQFPANERAARSALVTNFVIDHHGTNDANVGKHEVIRILEQGSDPAALAGEGKLYAKDVSGQSELFWRSDTGATIQITSGANGLLVNASNILSGTLADARLSTNVPLKNATNTFTAVQTISGTVTANELLILNNTNAGTTFNVDFRTNTVSRGAITVSDSGVALTGLLTLNTIGISDFARQSQSNTFTANQEIASTNPRLYLDDTNAGAGLRKFYIESDSGVWAVASSNDAGSGVQNAIRVTKNSSSIITAIDLAATAITVNTVNVTDFARLSQSNTFTGATQLISASGADATLNAARSGGATASLSGSSSYAIMGASSNHPLAILTNGTTRYEISSGGDHDFKAGTVTTTNSSAREVGFKGAPSVAISVSNNTSASNAGGSVHFTGGSGQTFTLDGDPPADTVIVLVNRSGNDWTIAASGTLTWAGSTGSRTMATGSIASAFHIGSGAWYISGNGLS